MRDGPSSGIVVDTQQQSGPAPSGYPEMTEAPAAVSRHRVLARTRLDFWLDVALPVGYVLAYSIGFTGSRSTSSADGDAAPGQQEPSRPLSDEPRAHER